MVLIIGIILSFINALMWSIVDFFSKILMDRKESEWYVLSILSITGAVGLFIAAMILNKLESISGQHILLLVGLGLFEVIAYVMFLKTLKLGKLSIAMPIAYSSAIVTVALSLIFYRETLNLWQIISIIGVTAGIIIVSYKKGKLSRNSVVFMAIVTMILYGAYIFLLKIPLQTYNAFTVTWTIAFTTGIVSLLYALASRKPYPSVKTIKISSLLGILEAIGFLSFAAAIKITPISIAATVKSIAPILGIIFAVLFLKEKLEKKEAMGIYLVIGSIILLSIMS